MNAKVVQVIIVPPHEQLDDPVQVRDRQAVRKPDPPPDRGMNIPQQDLQLKQQRRVPFDHRPDNSSPRRALPPFCDGLLGARAIRTVDALWNALGTLVDCFTPEECANVFRHDGYFQSA